MINLFQNNKQVGLLSTGDEIINGDIVDQNTQTIAQLLFENNIQPGTQLAVRDDRSSIAEALRFMLSKNQAVITTAGLGPTRDDLTRYAIADLVQLPLEFDQTTWQHIKTIVSKFHKVIPEGNKQQALFPKGATIIPNALGTAAGCIVQLKGQYIFMLPGPPSECFPMAKTVVIPTLIAANFQNAILRHSWLLLGASEGKTAQQLAEFENKENTYVGYRIDFPYLEIKLFAIDRIDFENAQRKITKLLQPWLISEEKQTASQQLLHYIEKQTQSFIICDQATCGNLQSLLQTPQNFQQLSFKSTLPDHPMNSEILIEIKGLSEYWQKEPGATNTEFHLIVRTKAKKSTFSQTIILHDRDTLKLAVESICWHILRLLHASEKNLPSN